MTKKSEPLKELSEKGKGQKESKELVQELKNASPKRFSGNFLFSGDFVNHLKPFVRTIVDKLDKARNQNEQLRRTIAELDIDKIQLARRNQNLSDIITKLKNENDNLKDDNKELKASRRHHESRQPKGPSL